MPIKQKKLFTFGKSVSRVVLPKERSVRAEKLKNAEDKPPFYIRGILAGSKEEYWCSLAADRFEEEQGWTWEYQVSVFGGRSRGAGGNVVDFLINTPGRKTMWDPMGRYWHTGINEDQSEMQNVARRKNWNLIAWFTDETPTRESVYVYLRDRMNV